MSSLEEQVRLLFEFLHHVSSLSAINSQTNEDGFATEFLNLKAISADLKNDDHIDTTIGSLPINKKKNRYKDILPFESRRVELHPIDGEEGSDYINASYIADPLNKLSYIAAQGPNSCTVDDFWRMLWYYAIEIVVMTCREVELGKSKCKCYWVSPGEVKQYGQITVTHISEENITEDFIQRKMHVRCGEEEQMLTQLHYTGWPDHGVPNDVLPILNVIRKFRAAVPYGNDVPIVIHCSAGCGRTGALIGIDYVWSLLEYKKFQTAKQVYEIVRQMRLQRPAMVQAKDQYILVYKAVFQLVRQYLEEYQHDPKVAHMFDSTTTQKLSQISLPEYQNPSGLDEATNIEMDVNDEEFHHSGHNTPMTTPKSSYDPNNLTPKTHPKHKPARADKPGLPRKPVTINKPPETPQKPQELAREIEKQTFLSEPEKTVFRKSSPPSLATKPLSVPKPPDKPKVDKVVHPPPKPAPHSSKGSKIPELSVSLPLNSNTKPVKVPLFPKQSERVSETIEENSSKQISSSLKEERKPIPIPTQAKVPIPSPVATNSLKQQGISSISELLTQASLDNGPVYSDDEDDYWDPRNNQPVSPVILQLNSEKNEVHSDDEDDYWEPKNNQPVSQSILKSNLAKRESISLTSPLSDSPPPLLPHRPFGGSQTNISSTSSIDTDLANAPPIPLKSMEDRDLMRSIELLSPPPSTFLVPNPVVSLEDDYDTITNVEKEISPIASADIYNTPRNDPLISNGKPVATPPYQPKGRIGMGGLIASFKNKDLFKQKSLNQTISHAPNIPISETVVTSDEQRRLNKRGKVEYGPVGFGIRLERPNGPRPTPKDWKHYAPESL